MLRAPPDGVLLVASLFPTGKRTHTTALCRRCCQVWEALSTVVSSPTSAWVHNQIAYGQTVHIASYCMCTLLSSLDCRTWVSKVLSLKAMTTERCILQHTSLLMLFVVQTRPCWAPTRTAASLARWRSHLMPPLATTSHLPSSRLTAPSIWPTWPSTASSAGRGAGQGCCALVNNFQVPTLRSTATWRRSTDMWCEGETRETVLSSMLIYAAHIRST